MKCVNSPFFKKERGDGGISYAMYFIAVIVTLVLFIFFMYESKSLVVEEVVENGLHIAENRILSSSQVEGYGEEAKSDFERDLDVLHIITNSTPGTSYDDPHEYDQVMSVAVEFSNALQEHLGLEGSTPTSGILTDMVADADAVVFEVSNGHSLANNTGVGAVIYEPQYSRTINRTSRASSSDNPMKWYDFEIDYNIDGWVLYYITYSDSNTVTNITKRYFSADSVPALFNGDAPEGATIEAAVSTKFTGIDNIFDGVSSASGPLFSRSPSRVADYDVCVIQAADIVPSSQDSRARR